MIDFEKDLNAEQLAVVRGGDGPCLVLAGAGSGKTRTITYRVAYLLQQGVAPEEILLVTFTNKAAREMVGRVAQLMAEGGRGDFHLPWSGTFHHIAYRVLRNYAPMLGYQNNFTVLDSADSADLIKLSLKHEGWERRDRRFPSPAVVQSLISFARNAERTLADVIEEKHSKWSEFLPTIERIAEDYSARKRAGNTMDFDDLLVNLRELLTRSEAVRNKFANQFHYVLVDEYQDTNTVQASIVRLLSSAHRNVLVVGDDAQSIYSFRAADIRNILDFERHYPSAKVFRLETNYRSTPEILALANEVIAENRDQYEKNLKSLRDPFMKPESRVFADNAQEAQFIVKRILQSQADGVPLRHIAVLFRAAFHSQALEIELTKHGIPYDYRGGVRFFERAHVKDALAYLRVFHNPADTMAWLRVLNMQSGIGPATADSLLASIVNASAVIVEMENGEIESKEMVNEEMASKEKNNKNTKNLETKKKPLPLEFLQSLSATLPARAMIGWNDTLSIWQDLIATAGTPAELISAVRESKYCEYLELQYPDYRERLQDIEQLALFAERESDLAKFLAEASMQESYAAVQARGAAINDDQLVLSTIHQAKGLEWDAVFIINLAAGQFPNERAVAEDRGLEEERRLFYVAITRAKRQLYLTYPLIGIGSGYLQGPSVFLSEINRELIDEHNHGFTASSITAFSSKNTGKNIELTYLAEDEPFQSTPKKRPAQFLKSIDEL